MLTPHVTPMSELPSAHGYEHENIMLEHYRRKNGEGTTETFTWVAHQDSVSGVGSAPAGYFSAEPGN